ncbi:MAG: cation transporter [Burkholderiaceae bacterium]|jgi:Co/Zn/Cd efflux system component
MVVLGDDADGTRSQARQVLGAALALNLVMFIVGVIAGVHAQSTGLIGDAFDMLADASGYAIALTAVDRGIRFKRNAARWNGAMLVALGFGVTLEVVRRYWFGSAPQGSWIIAFSAVSLCANAFVLSKLARFRKGEIHMRAAWTDTRADVIVNAGVLLSGLAIMATNWRYIDLGVGLAVGIFVICEGSGIIADAKEHA